MNPSRTLFSNAIRRVGGMHWLDRLELIRQGGPGYLAGISHFSPADCAAGSEVICVPCEAEIMGIVSSIDGHANCIHKGFRFWHVRRFVGGPPSTVLGLLKAPQGFVSMDLWIPEGLVAVAGPEPAHA